MGKIKLDGCPHCGKGDIALDKDQYGWYEYCLQCGYMRDLVNVESAPLERWSRMNSDWKATKLSESRQ